MSVVDHQLGGPQADRVPERTFRLILAFHGDADPDNVVEALDTAVPAGRLNTDDGYYWLPNSSREYLDTRFR